MNDETQVLDDGRVPSDDVLRHVFEAAPSAMLLVAGNGTIHMANGHSEVLFGHSRAQLLGSSVEILVPERFRQQHPSWRDGFLREPSVRAMGAGRDLYGLRRDGSEVPIEIGLNPLVADGRTYVLASIIDITRRKHAEDLLRASLAEKETLLREIHHRVKNNMQVVSSLLSMQVSNIEEPRYRAMFEECQARVRAMALIHEKLYASHNLASIDANDYVRDLVQMLARSYAQERADIRLELDTVRLALDIQRAIPIGLILNELVTNSLKHGFQGRTGGVIRVAVAQEDDGHCSISVRDDGCGLPEGLAPERSRGLGLRIVRGLVRQLDGVLECLPGPGASFRIRFPIAVAQEADARDDDATAAESRS